MIKTDENALICDLAETYHIFNYRQVSPRQIAIYAIGLKDDSRIKMKFTGQKIDNQTLMLANIIDRLNLLLWTKTKDAEKGMNRPKSILESLYKKDSEISAFQSGKEFEEERAKLLAERKN